jgi:Polyketide cyclase / dehydrase and lipid transport
MKMFIISALIVLVIVVVVAAAIFAIGSALPRHHRVIRSIFLHRECPEIYPVVRDFPSWPSWRPEITKVELLGSVEGKVRFREHSKHAIVTYEVMEDVPPRRLVTEIQDKNLGYSGAWTYEFSSEPGGAAVIISEDGEVSNVFFRFMSHYVFGQTSNLDKFLVNLGRRFGETVTPH